MKRPKVRQKKKLRLRFVLLTFFSVTWDQALFSFRFENYIPAGKAKAVRENVWEPLKLGLISGYFLGVWYATSSRIALVTRGVLPLMVYTGKLRPKGVPFSGFRYMNRLRVVPIFPPG